MNNEPYLVLGDPVPMENGKITKFYVDENVKKYDRLGYTTDLATVKLIFSNMTLRSSSLTNANLNDPIEKERVGTEKFAGSKFIICFSHENHESVPFWLLYGKKDRAKKILLQFQNFSSNLSETINQEYCTSGDQKCYFSDHVFNGHFGPNDQKLTPGLSVGVIDGFSIYDVKYVPLNDPVFTENHSGVANLDFSKISEQQIKTKIMAYDIQDLGKQKSNPWEYENETRILMSLIPLEFNHWNFMDLHLKPLFFQNLQVVLSPWGDESLHDEVRQIIDESKLPDEIKKTITVVDSGLKGKLNFPEFV